MTIATNISKTLFGDYGRTTDGDRDSRIAE